MSTGAPAAAEPGEFGPSEDRRCPAGITGNQHRRPSPAASSAGGQRHPPRPAQDCCRCNRAAASGSQKVAGAGARFKRRSDSCPATSTTCRSTPTAQHHRQGVELDHAALQRPQRGAHGPRQRPTKSTSPSITSDRTRPAAGDALQRPDDQQVINRIEEELSRDSR